MANATAAHALEFDDAFDEGGGMHAGPPVHSAALAVADSLGDVSGQDYLAAVAVGLDVAVRLALSPEVDVGWHRASAFAVFGATVAAGRLLGLDVEQMRNALGLALSQASGTRQPILEASLATRLHTGFAARNAVTAALLAQAGITAAQSTFEGPNGFFPLFQQGRYDRNIVLEDLGANLWASRISAKPYPGGRLHHALMEAALQLHDGEPSEPIETVTLLVPPTLAGRTAPPWPEGRQAIYSLPFGVALILATGQAPINGFVRPESTPPSVRALFDRTTVVADPTGSEHGIVEVTYRSGVTRRRVAERASGHPGRPLTAQAQLAKVWACLDHAAEPLSREAIRDVIDVVDRLEQLDSTTTFTALLRSTPS